jgi:hypothetical protein
MGKTLWLQLATVAAVLLLAGVLIGRGWRRERPPLVIERPVQSSTSSQTAITQTAMPQEQVYICGARTKKGKPCSRRVHGLVRCWQHKGLPAMLPPEQLAIKE